MADEDRTRRMLGIYIHIGDATEPGAARFTVVYAVGKRLMLAGMDELSDVAALFSHMTPADLDSMVQAVTTSRSASRKEAPCASPAM